MSELLRIPIRASAFFWKEIAEILRQPRLILALALGPFTILLLVGVGYRNQPRDFRTLFVVQESGTLGAEIQEFAPTLGPQLVYGGVTSDQEQALEQLRLGKVDLVIVAPTNAEEMLRKNEQPVFTLYHNEIDPFQVSYVQFVGFIYTEEVNRRLLRGFAERGQTQSSTVSGDVATARASATALREALERGDAALARQHREDLNHSVSALEIAAGAGAAVLDSEEEALGPGPDNGTSENLQTSLGAIREDAVTLESFEENQSDYRDEIAAVSRIEQNLAQLEAMLGEFQNVNP